MKRTNTIIFCLLSLLLIACSETGDDGSNDCNCDPGAQQACACVGGLEGIQVCKDDCSGWESCEGCPEVDGDILEDGDVADGDTPIDGDVVDGDEAVDGDVPDGDTPIDGDAVDGDEPIDGDVIDGDSTVDGDSVEDGDDEQCYPAHNSSACHQGDVYWVDACDNLSDIKEACGESGFDGSNYCWDGDVYRDYVTRGCNIDACASSTEGQKQEECGTDSCSDGNCVAPSCDPHHDHYECYNGDVFWYDACNVRNDKKEECGDSGFEGSDYCSSGDVYRDYVTKGCAGNSCTSNTGSQKQEECGVDDCDNWGSCTDFSSTCDESGNKYQTCYDRGCVSGACFENESQSTESCSRNTDGNSCSPPAGGLCDNGSCKASGCSSDESEWSQLGARTCSATFDDPIWATIDDSDVDYWVAQIVDSSDCEVGPGIEIDSWSLPNDLDIGAWYKCADGSYADIQCPLGHRVTSGYDNVCDHYPCCKHTTYSTTSETIEMSDVSCPGSDNDGWFQVKVYGGDISGCVDYRINLYQGGY